MVEGGKSVILDRQRLVPASLIDKEDLARTERITKVFMDRARVS